MYERLTGKKPLYKFRNLDSGKRLTKKQIQFIQEVERVITENKDKINAEGWTWYRARFWGLIFERKK